MAPPPEICPIDHLHDEALLAVFDRFLLIELLAKVDQVCQRWNRLRVVALARRRSITVLVNDPELTLIKGSCFNIPYLDQVNLPREHLLSSPEIEFRFIQRSFLLLSELTQDKANWLADTFPNVNTLRVVARVTQTPMSPVTFLLKQWRTKLVTFKLWLGECFSPDANVEFLAAINALPLIKRLLIEMHSQRLVPTLEYVGLMIHNRLRRGHPRPINFPQIELPVLARLKQFHFANSDHLNCLVDSLARYATSDLRDIRLVMINWNGVFPDYKKVPLAVRSNIHSISQEGLPAISVDSEFARGCKQFGALSALFIVLRDPTSMSQLASQLKPLARSLVCLKLQFQYYGRAIVRNGQLMLPLFGLIQADDEPIGCQLAGVRILLLWSETFKHRHTDLSPLRLAEIFPNLEVVKVREQWMRGLDCGQLDCSPEVRTKCIRRQMRPLEQCASLKTVFYSDARSTTRSFDAKELFRVPDQMDGPSTTGQFRARVPVLLGGQINEHSIPIDQ